MDPTQALTDLLRSTAQGDSDGTLETCFTLANWLQDGGFLPNVSEALEDACLNDLGLYQGGPHGGSSIPAIQCPSYWSGLGPNEEEGDVKQHIMSAKRQVPRPTIVLQARRNAEARDALVREFGLLTSAEIADLAGSTVKNRAALTNRWEQEGKIFSVPVRGVDLWPGFQLDSEGRPLDAITRVLSVFHHRASSWERALWFTSANGWLGARRPVDLLTKEPDAVVEAAQRGAKDLVF